MSAPPARAAVDRGDEVGVAPAKPAGAAPAAAGPAKTGAAQRRTGPTQGRLLEFGDVLKRLAEKQDLSRDEAGWVMDQLVGGEVDDVRAAAFLMGLSVKGETADEIAGLADGMRRAAIPVHCPAGATLVDVVGTGGDSLGTFNISTTAAFVAAGAGVKVAKHGNRAASSLCGSADVLEALGVKIDLSPQEVADCIDEAGMGFMLASLHHPAAGRVAGVRRALGVRTVFNLLGPLTNPAGVRRQLLGVSTLAHLHLLGDALARMGCEHALVVCGDLGMDELSVTGPSAAVEVTQGAASHPFSIEPEDWGVCRHALADLAGGGPAVNAAITREILTGRSGGPRDAVLLNAAAAIYVAGAASSLPEGVALARESIDSGRAHHVLERMIEVTNRGSSSGRARGPAGGAPAQTGSRARTPDRRAAPDGRPSSDRGPAA